MKIKKIVASTMPEAMKLIRAELGSDAVILNSKVIQTGGFFGLFKKRKIEVIAAIDPTPKTEPRQTMKQKQFTERREPSFSVTEQRESLIEKEQVASKAQAKEQQALFQEISELKKMMENMRESGSERVDTKVYPDVLQQISHLLEDQEIASHIQQEMMDALVEKWFSAETKPGYEEVLSWLKELLGEKIDHVPYGEVSYLKKYINVVGPTGVGKTTTLAKIAATAVLKHKKRAAFITTDTYRIAAIDQLKTYAKILCIPLEVCYTIEDFEQAIAKFDNYDVVFIDTAGRNFRNKQYVDDLQKMIQFDGEMETLLVLALTAKQKDMQEIYEQFAQINIDKLIFTKIDETSNYGAIINMIEKYDVGVAYLTNGQDVPDDIIAVDSNVIMNTIFGD